MVWVYNSPFTSREQKVYNVLKQKLKEQDIAKTTVKIISLYSFLKSSNFSSPKELRDSAFLDSKHTEPIFTEEQSKSVFKALKKKGGADSKYPFTNHVAHKGIEFVTTFVPYEVKDLTSFVYEITTSPVRIVKENVPFGDLLIDAMHGATETGVTVAGDLAEGVGGPVGAALVAPLTALAAGMASLVSLGEQDFGQAVAHISNAIPLIGSALGKGLTQMEHQVESLKKHPEVAEFLPVISEYVTGKPRRSLEEAYSGLSLQNLQEQAKARGMAELQKRGLPTSLDQAQEQAKSRGLAELQKRGLPTSTADLQSKAISKLQERLPAVPTAGKRFSTQRRKYSKWPKTQRRKYVKT